MRQKGKKIPNALSNRIKTDTTHICDKFRYIRHHSSCLFCLHYWPWLHVKIQSMRIKVQLNFRFVIVLYRKVKIFSYLGKTSFYRNESTGLNFLKTSDFIKLTLIMNWHMLIQFIGYKSKKSIRLSLDIHEYTMWVELI